MEKEAKARIKINMLLEEAGWRLLDNEHGKANVLLENHIKLTTRDLDKLGEDYIVVTGKSNNLNIIIGEYIVVEIRKPNIEVELEESRKEVGLEEMEVVKFEGGV